MLPISVCMIAKNEDINIDKCLPPLQSAGFEIVIVDTGSADCTREQARQYTNLVYDYVWQDDFSAARNFSIAQASNDWILVVDFDEYLEAIDIPALQECLSMHPGGIGTITRCNPCTLLSGQTSTMKEQVGRVFNRNYHHYEGLIHEQVLPVDGSDPVYFAVPVRFFHHGYTEPAVLLQKAERDLALLLKALQKNPGDSYLLYQIGKCYQVKRDYAKACDYFDRGLSGDLNPALSYVQDMIEAYGYSLLEQRNYEAALGLSGVYDLFSSHADFLFLMGLIYMNNALFEQAIAEFQKATSMKSAKVEGINSYLANYNIGVIYECMNQPDKAISFYQRCKNYSPALARLENLRK